MKVLDPQSALLTTAEVHQFLSSNPPRPRQKKIGTYKPVDLSNYTVVRQDFQHYVTTTVPYVANLPAPEALVKNAVPKLRRIGLTKAEALMVINLGIGTPRTTAQQQSIEDAAPSDGDEEQAESAAEGEQHEPDDRQLLSLVVEELEERYPGEEGEAQVDKILQIMKEAFDQAKASTAGQNGTTTNGGPNT